MNDSRPPVDICRLFWQIAGCAAAVGMRDQLLILLMMMIIVITSGVQILRRGPPESVQWLTFEPH